jgi:cytochrome P450 family 4
MFLLYQKQLNFSFDSTFAEVRSEKKRGRKMDTLLFIAILICTFFGWYYNKYRERMAIVAKLPGPYRWPIIGNAGLFVWKSPPEMVKIIGEIHRQFPRITCLMLGPQPEILISDPKLAEIILGSQKLIDKSHEYHFLSDWLATGLLTATGNKWFARRKVITPAFHFKILDQFVEIFDKQSAIFVQNLAKSEGRPMDVFEPIALCALDIISGENGVIFGGLKTARVCFDILSCFIFFAETAMGVQIQAQVNSDSVYVKAVKE